MLQYPDILDQVTSPFIEFNCFEWKVRGKREQNSQTTKTSIETIYLPISSSGLTESIINNWDISEDLNVNSASDFAKTFIGRKILGIGALSDLTKYFSFQTGQILNDYASLTFSGNNFREFNLTYDLYPTSGDEFKTVKTIANTFKKNSLPDYQGFKINYPRFWTLKIHIPGGDIPLILKDCVLVDCVSDLFKDENLMVYNDGGYNISLSLNFRELSRLSRSDIE